MKIYALNKINLLIPLGRILGGFQSRFGRRAEENFLPCRDSDKPVASRYTEAGGKFKSQNNVTLTLT
jgi:polyribonucleotide nucleotidyltransferase